MIRRELIGIAPVQQTSTFSDQLNPGPPPGLTSCLIENARKAPNFSLSRLAGRCIAPTVSAVRLGDNGGQHANAQSGRNGPAARWPRHLNIRLPLLRRW
jgi:hypothetical protein